MVRISLAAYNTSEDLDALVGTLVRITEGRYHGAYRQVAESGDYVPTPATGPRRLLTPSLIPEMRGARASLDCAPP